VLSTYILREVLEPERPADALAYLALTASDLWPRKGWNFVFGQANLRKRVGVWSLYRNGDPETYFSYAYAGLWQRPPMKPGTSWA
jgi:archaemetzincin